MKLSDIMEHAGLAFYPSVALVLFLLVFVVITVWVFRRSNRDRWAADARMPLDDIHPQQPRARKE